MYSLSPLRTRPRGAGRSVDVTEVAAGLPVHAAQVAHGAVEGDPHGFPDAGVPPLHHLQFVYGLVHAEGHHFGLGEPLPLEKRKDRNREQCSLEALHAAARQLPGVDRRRTPGTPGRPDVGPRGRGQPSRCHLPSMTLTWGRRFPAAALHCSDSPVSVDIGLNAHACARAHGTPHALSRGEQANQPSDGTRGPEPPRGEEALVAAQPVQQHLPTLAVPAPPSPALHSTSAPRSPWSVQELSMRRRAKGTAPRACKHQHPPLEGLGTAHIVGSEAGRASGQSSGVWELMPECPTWTHNR